MDEYGTLSEALEAAVNEGYSASFKMDADKLRCIESDRVYEPGSMMVVNHFRFEGTSNPDDMSVLYLVQCDDGTRGTIVDAYGTYAAPGLAEFIKRLPLDEGHPRH